ncbi:MAG: hypothetical protein ACRCXZ_04805 [Patescibacteria group bacterium]
MFTDGSVFNVLYTNKLQETKEFLRLLNIKPIEEEEDKLVYRLGDLEIHYLESSSESNQEYHYNANGVYGIGSFFYIGCNKFLEFYSQLKDLENVKISSIKPNNWETKEFMFEDPNGYKFVIYEDDLNLEDLE